MIRIVADDFEEQQAASLVEFVKSRFPSKIAQHGKVVDLDGPSIEQVEVLLSEFLRSAGLTDYGVLDHDEGILEIVHLKPEEEEEETTERLKPTMPFWPPYNVHPVKPSDMIEWSSRPKERKSLRKRKN